MKKIFILMVFLVVLNGCGNAETENTDTTNEGQEEVAEVVKNNDGTITINDMYGEKTLNEVPTNIVSLNTLYTEDLMYLDIYPVGATVGNEEPGNFPYYIEEELDFNKTEPLGNDESPNLDKIKKLEPDLIIASEEDKDIYEDLKEIAPTVIWEDKTEGDLLEYQDSLTNLSIIFDKEKEAEEKIAADTEKMETMNLNIENDYVGKTVMYIEYMDNKLNVISDEAEKFMYDSLEFKEPNYDALTKSQQQNVPAGDIKSLNPNFIIMATDGKGVEAVVKNKEGIKDSQAYKNEHIYDVDYNLWSLATGPIGIDLKINQVQENLGV